MQISLWNLANRLETDARLAENNPDKTEILKRRTASTKDLIAECLLQNKDNPVLKTIFMR